MSQRSTSQRLRPGPARDGSEVLAAPATRWLTGVPAAALVVLTWLLATGWAPLEGLDHAVSRWGYDLTYRHQLRTDWWTTVAEAGAPMVLRILLVVAGLYQLWRGRRALGAWLVAVPVAENVLAPLSKDLLNRPRPHWLHPIAVEHSTSFPSGHAAGAGMFVTAVALLAWTTLESALLRWAVSLAAAAVAAVVCLDRIFLGVHFLSDVVGGVLLGVTITLAGWLAMLAWERRHGREARTR